MIVIKFSVKRGYYGENSLSVNVDIELSNFVNTKISRLCIFILLCALYELSFITKILDLSTNLSIIAISSILLSNILSQFDNSKFDVTINNL